MLWPIRPNHGRFLSVGAQRYDRQGAQRGANQPLTLVTNLDLPDLGGASHMQRGGRRGQDPLAQRAEMIGIDLLTEGAHARWTVQERADGGGTLGQREIGSPVQETTGLAMARRDGHLHHDPLTADLDQLDLQRLVQAFHWGYVVHLTSFGAPRSSP